jgi:hypothetical protein
MTEGDYMVVMSLGKLRVVRTTLSDIQGYGLLTEDEEEAITVIANAENRLQKLIYIEE